MNDTQPVSPNKPDEPHKLSPDTVGPAVTPLDTVNPTVTSGHRNSMIVGMVVLLVLAAVTGYVSLHPPKAKPTPPQVSSSTTTIPHVNIAPAQVEITGAGYLPSTVVVKAGQAVVWTNADSTAHQLVSDNPAPSASDPAIKTGQPLPQNDNYSYIFGKAGSYGYHDPVTNFRGTVIVK